jgi:hypothetical protein
MRLKWNRQNPAAGVNGRAFVMSELQTDARGPDRRELPPQCRGVMLSALQWAASYHALIRS